MNIADALSGRAKLEGIQWLLLSATPRRALRDQLKSLLPAPNMLGPCRLRRVRFRPGRKLTGYYDARVRVEGIEGYRVRPIAVTWTVDGEADWRQAEAPQLAARPERQRGCTIPATNGGAA